MKRILIFYGSYGGGHLAAAKSIESYLNENYGSEVDVLKIDCIEYINKYINKVSTEAYKELAKKAPWMWKHVYKNSQNGALSHISSATNRLMSFKLNQLIQDFRPDLIISTHPFSTQMCAILKEKKKFSCPVATIMTDYHIHPQWLVKNAYMDYFFVSNNQMRMDMIEEGIPSKKIHVFGIPVSERFSGKFDDEKTCEEFGLDPNKKTILFFAGGEFGLGRNNTFMTLKALIRLYKNLQVVAISGKNKKMFKRFTDLVEQTNSKDRIKILEYTDKVPELMHLSSGVITKAGGLTITECIVSHKPICIINPIPGQEEENAEFLVNNNVAIWIKKGDNIARILKGVSRHPEKLKEMSENAKALAKPFSTRNICDLITKDFKDLVKVHNIITVSVLIKCKDKYILAKKDPSNEFYTNNQNIITAELSKDELIESGIVKNIKDTFGISKKPIVKKYDFEILNHTKDEKVFQIINLKYYAETDEVITFDDDSAFVLTDLKDIKSKKILDEINKIK